MHIVNIESQKYLALARTNPASLRAIFADKYHNVTLLTDDFRTLYCPNKNPPTEFNQTGPVGLPGDVHLYDPSKHTVDLTPYAPVGVTGPREMVVLTSSICTGPRGPGVNGVVVNSGQSISVLFSNGVTHTIPYNINVIEVDTPPVGTFPVFTKFYA